MENTWKKCSSCKKDIEFGSQYYACSVSTCNGKRTGYVFCTVGCFEAHLPGARHKDAAAVEEFAPKKSEYQKPAQAPQRRIVGSGRPSGKLSNKQISKTGDVLVVVSRLKEFINSQSDFNTSAGVMDELSIHIRHVAMQAIDNARAQGRKTVMEQDVKFLDRLNLNI